MTAALVTIEEESFIGQAGSRIRNADSWEKVLGWLDEYLSEKAVIEK